MAVPPNTSYDEKIIKDYRFKSIAQISKDIGKSYTFVRNRLVANNIKLRSVGGHPEFHEQIDYGKVQRAAFLYDRLGMSTRQVAEYEGVSRESIHRRLKISGVAMRPVGNVYGSRMPKDQFKMMLENRAKD